MKLASSSMTCKSTLKTVKYHRDLPDYLPLPTWTDKITDSDWTKGKIHLESDSLSKCDLCNFSFQNNISNSNSQDLVLSVLTHEPANVLTFIRTLRTTGSKCTCILLADKDLILKCTSDMNRIFNECGLQIINVGTVSSIYNSENIRYILYYKFMLKYHDQFSRVMLVDAHNTIFQTDPFTTDFDHNTLSVSSECITHGRCPWNGEWIYEIDRNATKNEYENISVTAGGLVWGYVPKVMGFLETIVTSPVFATDDAIRMHKFPIEQSVVTMLIHRNVFKSRGYDVNVESNDHPIGALFHCWFRRYFDSNEYPVMRKTRRKKVVLSVMHQYNRYSRLLNYTYDVCAVDQSLAQYAYAEPTQVDFLW